MRLRAFTPALLASVAAGLVFAGAGAASADPVPPVPNIAAASAADHNPAYADARAIEALGLAPGTIISDEEVTIPNLDAEARLLKVIGNDGKLAVTTVLKKRGSNPSSVLVHLAPTDLTAPGNQPSATLLGAGELNGESLDKLRQQLESGDSLVTVPDSYGQTGEYIGLGNGERIKLLVEGVVQATGMTEAPIYGVGSSGSAYDLLRAAEAGLPFAGIWASATPANGPQMLAGARGDVSAGLMMTEAGQGALTSLQYTDPELYARVINELQPSLLAVNAAANQVFAQFPMLELVKPYGLALIGLNDQMATKNGLPINTTDNPALAEMVEMISLGKKPIAPGTRVVLSCSSEDRFLDCASSKELADKYRAMGADVAFVETEGVAWPNHVDPEWKDQKAVLFGLQDAPAFLAAPAGSDPVLVGLLNAAGQTVQNTTPAIGAALTPHVQNALALGNTVLEAFHAPAPLAPMAPGNLDDLRVPAPLVALAPPLSSQTWGQDVTATPLVAVHAEPEATFAAAADQAKASVAPELAPFIDAAAQAAGDSPVAQHLADLVAPFIVK